MPEAAAVGDALGVKLVKRIRDFGDFVGTEEASHNGVTIPPIVREIRPSPFVRGDLPLLRNAHKSLPTLGEDTSSL